MYSKHNCFVCFVSFGVHQNLCASEKTFSSWIFDDLKEQNVDDFPMIKKGAEKKNQKPEFIRRKIANTA